MLFKVIGINFFLSLSLLCGFSSAGFSMYDDGSAENRRSVKKNDTFDDECGSLQRMDDLGDIFEDTTRGHASSGNMNEHKNQKRGSNKRQEYDSLNSNTVCSEIQVKKAKHTNAAVKKRTNRNKRFDAFINAKEEKKGRINKLNGSSATLSLNSNSLESLPVPIIAQIYRYLDLQGFKNLRFGNKKLNEISQSDLLSSRYCLTIVDKKVVRFINNDKFTNSLFAGTTKKKRHNTFTSHPAALKYVFGYSCRKFDEQHTEININRVLMFNKNLTTFILEISPEVLEYNLSELADSLNLKDYIHTLVLPICSENSLGEALKQRLMSTLKHIKRLELADSLWVK